MRILFRRKKIYKKYLITRLCIRRRKRKYKQVKKHADKFFQSRKKKFLYYYKKFMKTYNNTEYNFTKNQLTLNYKFAIQGLTKKYIKIWSMISLIKMIKIYRRIMDLDKHLMFKVVTYPDFWLTNKPKAVRMGKGKAALSYAINIFYGGNIFVEWRLSKKIQRFTRVNRLGRIRLLIKLLSLGRQLKMRVQTKNIIKSNMW